MAVLLFRDGPADDPLSLITAARIAACADIAAPVGEYLKADLSSGTAANSNQISVADGVVLRVGELVYRTQAMNIGAAQLDAGTAFEIGRDYYVYLCDLPPQAGAASLRTGFRSTPLSPPASRRTTPAK